MLFLSSYLPKNVVLYLQQNRVPRIELNEQQTMLTGNIRINVPQITYLGFRIHLGFSLPDLPT